MKENMTEKEIVTMMTECFAEALALKVAGILEDDGIHAYVDVKKVLKNNGKTYLGLSIQEEEKNISPTIYIDEFVKRYPDQMQLMNHIQDVADWVIDAFMKARKEEAVFDISDFMDWNIAKTKICFKVVSFERNEELLKDVPYQKAEDLAKVYYFWVGEFNEGSGSILIHNNHLEIWGITAAELDRVANNNTPKLLPESVQGMSEVLAELMGADAAELMGIAQEEEQMYVCSNATKVFGASALFYPGVLEKFRDEHGDFFILPSSIHEALLISKKEAPDVDTLRQMVREVNDTQVDVEERLSYSVYEYTEDGFRIATDVSATGGAAI